MDEARPLVGLVLCVRLEEHQVGKRQCHLAPKVLLQQKWRKKTELITTDLGSPGKVKRI